MKAIIFASGSLDSKDLLKKYWEDADIILCADGGFRYAKDAGIVPDKIIGDMDSISGKDLELAKAWGVKLGYLPRQKEYTDTMHALQAAVEFGATRIYLLAGLGDRPDHSLANIFLMVEAKKMGSDLILVGEGWEMFLISAYREVHGNVDDILSLIPINGPVTGVETSGLYYPLKKEDIPLGTPRGISNVFTESKATIKLQGGLLLAIKIAK